MIGLIRSLKNIVFGVVPPFPTTQQHIWQGLGEAIPEHVHVEHKLDCVINHWDVIYIYIYT